MTLFVRERLHEVFLQTGTTMLLASHDLKEDVHRAGDVLLLTQRPTRVAEFLRFDEPRPRAVETLSRSGSIATKKPSLEISPREVRR